VAVGGFWSGKERAPHPRPQACGFSGFRCEYSGTPGGGFAAPSKAEFHVKKINAMYWGLLWEVDCLWLSIHKKSQQ